MAFVIYDLLKVFTPPMQSARTIFATMQIVMSYWVIFWGMRKSISVDINIGHVTTCKKILSF